MPLSSVSRKILFVAAFVAVLSEAFRAVVSISAPTVQVIARRLRSHRTSL
jgi:hypothetical protein